MKVIRLPVEFSRNATQCHFRNEITTQKPLLLLLTACVKEVQASKFGEEGGPGMRVSRLYSVLQFMCCDSVRSQKKCNYRRNLNSHENSAYLKY
jgi:hypothetical protein